MTFQIRSADGHIYTVSTEVGEGLARVCVTEDDRGDEPTSIDQTGDE